MLSQYDSYRWQQFCSKNTSNNGLSQKWKDIWKRNNWNFNNKQCAKQSWICLLWKCYGCIFNLKYKAHCLINIDLIQCFKVITSWYLSTNVDKYQDVHNLETLNKVYSATDTDLNLDIMQSWKSFTIAYTITFTKVAINKLKPSEKL